MGDTRYWMWTRRRFGGSSKVQSSVPYYDSWEEQAFAEDSSGLLGGCIWPPRSYSCTFCRREFRSAQALGGHMNVHRRDRARLRQSPNSQGDQASNQNPCGIIEYPHEVCSFPRPKPIPNPNPILITTPVKPIAPLSTFCNQNSLIKNGLSISSNCQKLEQSLGMSQLPNSPRINNSLTVEILTLHDDQKLKGGMNCDVSKTESTAGISSTELVFGCRKRSFDVVESSDEEDGEMRKRLRSSTKSSTDIALPLFLRQTTVSSHDLLQHSPLQRDLFRQGTAVIEELDLELRLGQRPEVK